jgi:hypothetical protein
MVPNEDFVKSHIARNPNKICLFQDDSKIFIFGTSATLVASSLSLDPIQVEDDLPLIRFPKAQLQYYTNKLVDLGHTPIVIDN